MVVRVLSSRSSLAASPCILTLRSPSTPNSTPSHLCQQKRNAQFIPRPRRPYTFTQLVVLSDGSTYQHRTTSPIPVYKSVKDTRNTALWNPTSESLANVEVDEAGRLAMFRERYGRGWDAKSPTSAEVEREGEELAAEELDGGEGEEEAGGLMDLISSYGSAQDEKAMNAAVIEEKASKKKGKAGGKK